MNLNQRRTLTRTKRLASQVPKAKSKPDKRRAVRQVLNGLYTFLGARRI